MYQAHVTRLTRPCELSHCDVKKFASLSGRAWNAETVPYTSCKVAGALAELGARSFSAETVSTLYSIEPTDLREMLLQSRNINMIIKAIDGKVRPAHMGRQDFRRCSRRQGALFCKSY